MDRSEERHYSLSVPSSSFKIMKMYIGASKLKLGIAHFSQGKTWFYRGTISLVKNHKNIRVLKASDLLNAMHFFFSFLFFLLSFS